MRRLQGGFLHLYKVDAKISETSAGVEPVKIVKPDAVAVFDDDDDEDFKSIRPMDENEKCFCQGTFCDLQHKLRAKLAKLQN